MKKSIIKRIAYNPFLVRIFRLLRLRKLMRNIYYKFTRPEDNILKIVFGGRKLFFYVNSSINMRIVETAFSESKLGGEKPVLDFLVKNTKKGDVVLDVGANVGVHSVLMAKLVGEKGKVVSFEPERETFKTLRKNITLNNLSNVILQPFALSDRKDKKNIYFTGDTGGFSLIENSGKLKGTDVELVVGDKFIEANHLPLPKVVKIDVEGYEFAVIVGLEKTLKNKICQMICCEIHPTLLPSNIKPDMVIELLKSYGFNQIETHPRGESFHAFCYKRQTPTANNELN